MYILSETVVTIVNCVHYTYKDNVYQRLWSCYTQRNRMQFYKLLPIDNKTKNLLLLVKYCNNKNKIFNKHKSINEITSAVQSLS